MSTLCLDNYRVIEFYKKHPNINFEDVNLFVVDVFEKFFENDIESNKTNKDIIKVLENLNKENFNTLIHKLAEIKKEISSKIDKLKSNLLF